MAGRIPQGFMTQQEADRMLASFPPADRERLREAVQELVWHEPAPSHASRYDDDDADLAEFAHLFPPKSATEADRRRDAHQRRIAASAAELSDDELFERLFGRSR